MNGIGDKPSEGVRAFIRAVARAVHEVEADQPETKDWLLLRLKRAGEQEASTLSGSEFLRYEGCYQTFLDELISTPPAV